MECNKDEATRAKEIAEKKFNVKDIAGAKKFALKAQTLYPGLEGIFQFLATLDVYICAENKTNGEADWYGILGLTPLADDETVRKQYRKLALVLHPDKNKSVGAEGAFKLISQAWSLLSDKTKKAAYDQRRISRVFQQKEETPSQGQTATPGSNGFYSFAKSTTASGRSNKNTRANNSSAPGAAQETNSNSFWTLCHKCKMQYEYLRIYLNHNLICPNCRKPFFAIETPPPVSNGLKSPIPWNSSQCRRGTYHEAGSQSKASNIGSENFSNNDGNNPANFQWTPFSGAGSASSVAHAASVVRQTYEKVKKERRALAAHRKQEKAMKRKQHIIEEMGGVSSSEPSSFAKKRRGVEEAGSLHINQSNRSMGGVGVATGNPKTIHMNGINKTYGRRDLSQIEIREMLMEKAKSAIDKKVSEWKSNVGLNNAIPKEKAGEKALDEENGRRSNNAPKQRDAPALDDSFQGASVLELDKALEPLSITVPDPDFYDFDKDRTEISFEENQVWAAYDDDDGMPRYYAMIHNVISQDPFKVRISWLNSRTNTELSSMDWVGSGFAKTCGDFRVGRHETNDSLNSFSHKIWWSKGARGVIQVFPRKGDVWALYRNWSPDWDELTPNDIIHKYDVVEVLEDYDEAQGVVVTPLVKVAGFKTVFRQHLDQSQVRRIPREEMFRFSHQVPWHLITAQEAPDTLKGCMELDPAATPADLLHVIADTNEDGEIEVNTEEEEVADGLKKDGDRENLKGNHEEGWPKAARDLTRTQVVEILEID